MYDELHAICDKHGIFLRRDAISLGYKDQDLARAVRQGVLHRVRQGSYVFRDRWDALSANEKHATRAMAVLRTARVHAVLSHTTAAMLHQAPTWELPFDDVHITRRDRRSGRRETGLAQHRGLLRPGDVVELDGTNVTSPCRTALDLTTIMDVEHCLPVFDHFLHACATTKAELRHGAAAMALWSGTLHTDLVIALANPRCESVGESRTSYMLWRNGVPAPETAYEFCDSHGNLLFRVDFAWPELGVFLEFDGKEKYLKYRREGESVADAVLREKRREEWICRLTGWRCIRIVWADLYRPEKTCTLIKSVLAGGPVHV
jgi:hypothetical protein